LKILSELVLLLPNTDSFQQFEDFCQEGGQYLVEVRTSSDNNFQIVEGCQYLVEVKQALTKFSNC
jgi:hypothetical protein